MSAKLSIIVPVYNAEKYLAGCLDSLLAQTLRDIEIICVDDGSTDDCPKILKRYAEQDNRIRIITQKNSGQGAARNAALKFVTTELVTFVDSDDILAPNAYELALSKMTDDIDFVHFGIKTVGSRSKEIQQSDDDYYDIKFSNRVKIDENVLKNSDVSPCNKIFRKSIIDKYKILFPEGLRYEDAYFFYVYGMRSKFGFYIKDKLYTYIRHDGSIMTQTFENKPGHSIDHVKIVIKIYEYLVANDLFKKWRHYFAHLFFAYFDCAIRYENTQIGQSNIFDLAIDFLSKNKLSFCDYPDVAQKERLLRHRLWNHTTQKKFFGLIRIKIKDNNTRVLFCGIPILRIKYCDDKVKYYPFATFCLYEKSVPKQDYMPKSLPISVVIPCYNVSEFLPECLDSVLNQSFKDFEIVCVEDCSTDSTRKILKQYAQTNKNIRIIYNEKNKGLAISRNIGMDASNGEYIYFLDSDDTIDVDCLKELYHKITTDKCDMVMGAIKPYAEDTNNEFCIRRTAFLKEWVKFTPFTKLQITKRNGCVYYDKLYCCAVNKLYNHAFLVNNRLRFINKNCPHEDNGFWLKVLSCCPLISGIETETYFYRIRNHSITNEMDSDKEAHLKNYLSVLSDALNFSRKSNKPMAKFIKSEIDARKTSRFYRFIWNKRERTLRILRFTIFKLKYYPEKNIVKLTILGIRICKWRKK